mgnify:FL=1
MANKLNRRDILERMAMVTGGAVSLTLLSACDGGVSVPENVENIDLKALNKEQLDLVADLADAIIPDTQTPGAKSVNVHYFVDELAANWMTAKQRTNFLDNLTALDQRIKDERGSSFSNLSADAKNAALDSFGLELLTAASGNGAGEKHIYLELRELIIFGYYTSEVGASEELLYDPIPGGYKGCIPFDDVGKTWSS